MRFAHYEFIFEKQARSFSALITGTVEICSVKKVMSQLYLYEDILWFIYLFIFFLSAGKGKQGENVHIGVLKSDWISIHRNDVT